MANRRSLAACWLAAGLALALVTQTAVAGPVIPRAQTVKNVPHRQPLDEPIPVKEVPVAQRQPSATDKAALKETPAVSWPAAGSATLTTARTVSGRARSVAGKAGGLPLQVAPVGAPASVRVDLLDRGATAKAGISGLLLRVRRTDSAATGKVVLGLDYSGFAHAYGADWGSRLQFRRLSDGKTLGTNNARTSRLSAEIPAAGAESLYAVTAGPAGQGGNYAATSLALSGEWSTSGQTGEFTWNYGLRVPEVPGGLAPQLALSYSSGAVDGRTASTNNQTSWIGEGFDMWSGYIERNYRGCNDDKTGSSTTEDTGDQCWFSDNATLSLGGHSGPLVKVGTSNSWRLQNDDGTLIERVYGAENGDNDKEYWKVTTADGTQYYFGRNRLPNWPADKQTNSTWLTPVFGNQKDEPCENGAYASSWCHQAYRWNLDHVVDRHGNSMTYYYEKERNSYGLNRGRTTVGYDRGGVLVRAEYGTRLGSEVPGAAPASVVFGSEGRCLRGLACSTANKGDYPDTPLDQTCTANCTTLVSPTFFTTKRLTSVTTKVGATEVERWSLRQTFPSPGDSTAPSLWLAGITHHGLTGTKVSLPEVTFGGEPRDNRVNADNDVTFPMVKYRVDEIKNEYGGIIAVTYAQADCATTTLPVAWDNKKRCFPVYWQPDGSPAMNDWFHKYVVASVVQQDPIAGSPAEQTTYQYLDGGAWNYSENELVKPERRSWSEWRGYQRVVTTHGDPADTDTPLGKTEYRYYRGMNGDRLNNSGGVRTAQVEDSTGGKVADEPWLNGRVREQLTFDGVTGPVIGGTITDTWQRGPTATQGIVKAYMVQTGAVRERNALPEGKWRQTRIDRSYYDDGLVATIEDLGDVSTPADDECSTTTYARATGSAVTGLPAQVKTVNKACSVQASAADLVSDVHTYYDNSTVDGFIGAKGDATSVRQLSGVTNGVAEYVTATRTTYDTYGRPLQSTDALGNKTGTSYLETGGLTSKITITNALGQKTETQLDTKWGEPVIATEPSGNRTDVSYDSLGRVSGVWLPGRSGRSGYAPNLRYGYHVRDTGPTAVSTETLRAGGNLLTSYALYDGFLRSRQTQSPGWGEGGAVQGRVVSETSYNSRGMVKTATGQYYAEGAPGTTLVEAGENNQPSQTDTKYDAMGRPVTSTFKSKAADLWTSTTEYLGDRVKYTPPAGGTSTTTFLDADGRTTELHQHRGPLPEGPADITKYTYARGGQLATVTDPAGNQWRYQYDVQGRQIAGHDPDKGDSTSKFDVGGRLLSTTDARGKTLAFDYDALGRKVNEREGSATGPVRATWVYDTLKPGLPTSSRRTDGAVTYTSTVLGYDDAGRPTGTRLAIPAAETGVGGNYDTLMTYRADGSPDTVTMPRAGDLPAETLSYDYDALGLQDTLKSGTGTAYVNDTWYTRFGELAHTSLGAVGKMVWNNLYYDPATRRLDQNLVERESGGPAEVNDFRFDYDAVGNVTRIADVPDGGPADRQCFSYDYLRRMTEAWTPTATCGSPEVGGTSSPYWTSYRYDVVGNRTSEVQHAQAGNTTRTYTYPAAGQPRPHALTSVSTSGPTGSRQDTIGYDTTGNTTSRNLAGNTQQFGWDTAGRLTTSTSADGKTTTIGYDAEGSRLIRRDPGSTTLYLAGQELRYDKATLAKKGTRFYSYGESVVAVRTAAGLFWQFGDHHDTATSTVAADSLAITRRQFTPFGDTRGTGAAWPSESGFVGGTRDDSLGLTQLGAREYDASTGRFLSVDPIIDPDDPQQLNAYAYSNNNPASMSDPDGLKYFVDVEGRVSIPPLKYATPKQISRAAKQAKKITRANVRYKANYERKVKASGHSAKEYQEALEIKEKSVIDVVLEAGGEVLKEFLGINDIKGCFGDGDLGSCIAMVINVIPWSKLFRIGELIGAVKKAWKSVTNFLLKRERSEEVIGDVTASLKGPDLPEDKPSVEAKSGPSPGQVEDEIKERNTRAEVAAKGPAEVVNGVQRTQYTAHSTVDVNRPSDLLGHGTEYVGTAAVVATIVVIGAKGAGQRLAQRFRDWKAR